MGFSAPAPLLPAPSALERAFLQDSGLPAELFLSLKVLLSYYGLTLLDRLPGVAFRAQAVLSFLLSSGLLSPRHPALRDWARQLHPGGRVLLLGLNMLSLKLGRWLLALGARVHLI